MTIEQNYKRVSETPRPSPKGKDRGKGGFKGRKVGQRSVRWEGDRLQGRWSLLFPNGQSSGILLSTLTLYKERRKEKPGAGRVSLDALVPSQDTVCMFTDLIPAFSTLKFSPTGHRPGP